MPERSAGIRGEGEGRECSERIDMGVRHASKIVLKHSLTTQARQLRQKQTPEETALWALLRQRSVVGLKFRRQHQVGRYIVDFYCAEKKLVLELDGAGHFTPEGRQKDRERDSTLAELGLKVLRFPNSAKQQDILAGILNAVMEPVKP